MHNKGDMSKRGNVWRALLRREDGVATTEYVALLVFVTLSGSAAVVSLGVPLYNLYKHMQILIALPIP
jgi:hypothetical protein